MRLFISIVCSLLLNVLIQWTAPVMAAPEVTLTVSPHVQFAPGKVKVVIRIEPDARNRGYCFTYVGGTEGSTCRQLDGQNEPRTRELPELKDLAGGEYVGQVTVARVDGTVVRSNPASWTVRDTLSEP